MSVFPDPHRDAGGHPVSFEGPDQDAWRGKPGQAAPASALWARIAIFLGSYVVFTVAFQYLVLAPLWGFLYRNGSMAGAAPYLTETLVWLVSSAPLLLAGVAAWALPRRAALTLRGPASPAWPFAVLLLIGWAWLFTMMALFSGTAMISWSDSTSLLLVVLSAAAALVRGAIMGAVLAFVVLGVLWPSFRARMPAAAAGACAGATYAAAGVVLWLVGVVGTALTRPEYLAVQLPSAATELAQHAATVVMFAGVACLCDGTRPARRTLLGALAISGSVAAASGPVFGGAVTHPALVLAPALVTGLLAWLLSRAGAAGSAPRARDTDPGA